MFNNSCSMNSPIILARITLTTGKATIQFALFGESEENHLTLGKILKIITN